MFKIISALFSTFRVGNELRNAGAWKNAQIIASLLTAIIALVAAFGYNLGVSSEEIAGGAAFIVAVANGLITVMSSKKVGIPNAKNNSLINAAGGVCKPLQPKTSANERNQFEFPTERNG